VICQGVLSEEEVFYIHQCKVYGTQVVAWVKAGSGGKEKLGLPIFDSVREARRQTSANVSFVFVDPPFVADAIIEAIEGGIENIICFTSGVLLHDMVKIQYILSKNKKSRVIGPSSCGLITPSQCKAGAMPGYVFAPGPVGIISSVDTLGYEAAWHITNAGLGQTTFVGIGNEAVRATSAVDVLAEFDQDAQTEAILLILQNGESGVDAIAEWVEKGSKKPILAVISGYAIPITGHLSSVLTGEAASGKDISDVLRNVGVRIIEDIATIGFAVEQAIMQSRLKEFVSVIPPIKKTIA
jgi:succinyl-CoA synthetase alpha subunit